jgi:hypothetical protein
MTARFGDEALCVDAYRVNVSAIARLPQRLGGELRALHRAT